MDEIEQALLTHLNTIVDCEIYPGSRPQKSVLPCITYQRKSGGYSHDLAGAGTFANPYFDIEIFAKLLSDCLSIGEQIRVNLQGYSGTVNARVIYFITLDDESENYFAPVSATASGIFSTTQNYRIMYKEN